MGFNRQIIHTDRDGDTLEVVPRDPKMRTEEHVISVRRVHWNACNSVCITDEQLPDVIKDLCEAFGFVAFKNDSPDSVADQCLAYLESVQADTLAMRDVDEDAFFDELVAMDHERTDAVFGAMEGNVRMATAFLGDEQIESD